MLESPVWFLRLPPVLCLIIPCKARMRGLWGSSAHNETKKVTEKGRFTRHFQCEKGRKDTGSREMPLLRKPAEAASDIRRLKNTPKAVYIRSESSLYILVTPQPSDYPRIAFYKKC